jgi:alanine racemase
MKPAAYAVLDLDAVQHNLAVVHRAAPTAKIMAVIKANGYGHGLLRIAEAAKQVDGFAVARIEEAIRLRNAGFQHRILLLEGFSCAEELEALQNYQLEAVVHCFEQISLLEQSSEAKKITVWLKLDSGMNRLGFKNTDFALAHQHLTACNNVNPQINLITHLANADDKNDVKTLAQIQLFKETVSDFEGECSIANSAGLLAWQESLTDWVRPGLMLYGISPFAEQTGEQLGLKPVMSLYSKLIAVKQLEAGEKVGYSGTWICDKPTRLGVIAIGYGDGYPRYAKNGTPVLVNGQRVPLIGRVSMDMITVDLNSQPEAKMGDVVTLWGDGLPVEEIALCSETIPYTLVCGITQRVQIVER